MEFRPCCVHLNRMTAASASVGHIVARIDFRADILDNGCVAGVDDPIFILRFYEKIIIERHRLSNLAAFKWFGV